MGIWDEYCLICGGPIRNDFDGVQEIYSDESDTDYKAKIKEYDWLNKLFLILSNNKIMKANNKQYNSYGEIVINRKVYTITPFNYHQDWKYVDGYGVVCHQDCYNLLEKSLKYELLFSDVCQLLAEGNSLLKQQSKYAPMNKYISQIFKFYYADRDNEWILESPLENSDNKKRILNIWKPLVIKFKKNPPKPYPCEPANKFKIGTVLEGFDQELWVVKSINGIKKWIPYNENIIVKPAKKSSRKRSRK